MISPLEVYLVMQLDSINRMFQVAFGLGIAYVVVVAMFIFIASFDQEEAKDMLKAVPFKRSAAFLVGFSLLATAFLPSTKTAAAMIVLPALTSDQVVKPVAAEAKELYELAKGALREAAGPDSDEE